VQDRKPEEPFGIRLQRLRDTLEAAPNAAAKREFAAALREVLDELEATSAPADAFTSQARQLRKLADELRRHPPLPPPETGPVGYTGMENFYDRSPIVGLANPLAPPAELQHFPEEKCVRGNVEFGKSFEGGPGLVHGGFLAALLDEALGVVTVYSGDSGMTGEYTLRYHAPTRIKVPLHFEARFDRLEGRKIYVSADLWEEETRTVSATGLFIQVSSAKFEAFQAERSKRIGER
jgi:acyl-coenzyme A thioesterase PaaI-like protein